MSAEVAELPGVTVVSERAVRRIAEQATCEVAGVQQRAEVTARVFGDSAVLDVRLAVRYPQPVARIADACREHLIHRTGELTGLAVSRVDIEISAMPVAAGQGRVL